MGACCRAQPPRKLPERPPDAARRGSCYSYDQELDMYTKVRPQEHPIDPVDDDMEQESYVSPLNRIDEEDRVFTFSVGDEVEVLDGKGKWWPAVIREVMSSTISASIDDGWDSVWSNVPPRNVRPRQPAQLSPPRSPPQSEEAVGAVSEAPNAAETSEHQSEARDSEPERAKSARSVASAASRSRHLQAAMRAQQSIKAEANADLSRQDQEELLRLCEDIGIGAIDSYEGEAIAVDELLDLAKDNRALMMSEIAGESQVAFEVSSAGSAEFNGVYVVDGKMEGKPRYRKKGGDKQLCLWRAGIWFLSLNEGSYWYYATGFDDLPPETGWSTGSSGQSPPPALALQSPEFVRARVGTHIKVANAGSEDVNGFYTALPSADGSIVFKKNGASQIIDWHPRVNSSRAGWFIAGGSGVYFTPAENGRRLPTGHWEPYELFPFKPGVPPMPSITASDVQVKPAGTLRLRWTHSVRLQVVGADGKVKPARRHQSEEATLDVMACNVTM